MPNCSDFNYTDDYYNFTNDYAEWDNLFNAVYFILGIGVTLLLSVIYLTVLS